VIEIRCYIWERKITGVRGTVNSAGDGGDPCGHQLSIERESFVSERIEFIDRNDVWRQSL
jgi:hypothetical protein